MSDFNVKLLLHKHGQRKKKKEKTTPLGVQYREA